MVETLLNAITLPGVTGGQSVTANEVTHGLDDEDKPFSGKVKKPKKARAAKPGEQSGSDSAPEDISGTALGALESGLPKDATSATSSSGGASNAIDIKLQKLLIEEWESGLESFFSTRDPVERQARELADRVVQETLKELVGSTAVLFVPPDEFARVHQELREAAEKLVKEAQKFAKKESKKLPLNETEMKRSLCRSMACSKFRARHNALFHYPGIENSAPETGIRPVAKIHGEYGGIGPQHGRYQAGTR